MTTAIRLDTLPAARAARRQRPPFLHWAARNRGRHWTRDVVRVALLGLTDLGTILAVGVLARVLPARGWLGSELGGLGLILTAPFAVALAFALAVVGAYGPRRQQHDGGRIAAAVVIAAFMLLYREMWGHGGAAGEFATLVATLAPGLVLSRTLVETFIATAGPLAAPERWVVVGNGSSGGVDQARLALGNGAAAAPRRVVATIATDARQSNAALARLPRVVDETQADTVLIAGPLSDGDFAFVADTALASGCRLLAAACTTRFAGVQPRTVWEANTTLVELTAPGRQAWYLVAKRVVDLCLSALALALLSPVFLVLGALIKLDSPGPAIFAHWRLGTRGRMFRCYKFRSMRQDAEQVLRAEPRLHQLYVDNGYKIPAHLDPRLTRVGRFLRKCSLDELPQFFNVLVGDMSLVGPRPIVTDELGHYGRTAPLFLSRKPGITGNWAADGRSDVGYPDRADVELAYARQWSLFHDLAVLLRTVPAVALRRGAH